MLKLKPQNFSYLMASADSLEKSLMLEETEARGVGGNRGCDGWMASLTDWTGDFPGKILEWVAISFSRRSSQPKD